MSGRWGFGQRSKKLTDLATIIDEAQLSADSKPIPLDDTQPDSVRSDTFKQEIVTAIQEIKDVSIELTNTGNRDNIVLARRLMASRQALKLLARSFFE